MNKKVLLEFPIAWCKNRALSPIPTKKLPVEKFCMISTSFSPRARTLQKVLPILPFQQEFSSQEKNFSYPYRLFCRKTAFSTITQGLGNSFFGLYLEANFFVHLSPATPSPARELPASRRPCWAWERKPFARIIGKQEIEWRFFLHVSTENFED